MILDNTDGQPTILIVDDAVENIDILSGVLSDEYDIMVALTGEEALGTLETSDPPDIILLDILMPGIDGFEVCRRLKSNDRFREIPIIFVTAMDEVADEAKGFAVGGVDYITKPISPPIVRARVKAQLELKAAREDLKKQNEILKENLRLREDMESIIRHDLKSPLSVVMWVPEVLRIEENLTDKQIKTLNILQQAGNSMLRIINSSINMIKIERGEYVLEPVPVDLLSIARQVTSELNGLLNYKKLIFEKVLNGRPVRDTDTFILEGEDILLYSMLANLVKNAIEASPEDKKITISFEDIDRRKIRIHNVGEISEDMQVHFFQKYCTSKKKIGTGLGTYSAKLIAEIHQGEITLEVDKEEGITVTISFPKQGLLRKE